MRSLLIVSLFFTLALSAADKGKAINSFFAALISADVKQLEVHYADKILLKKGSEFLKPNWGIKGADRSKDCTVTRQELMAAYKKAFAQIGKKKWQGIFTKLGKNSLQFKQLANKNLQLRILTGPGDDYLEFEFSLMANDQYKIVAEYTDY